MAVSWTRRVYYDIFSFFYDRVIALHSKDESAALRSLLVDRAGVREGGRLLDLCTGTGAVALRAAQAFRCRGLVVGLDFSRGMIRRAREKARREELDAVLFVQAEAARLPFRSECFDAVTCSHAMYELSPEVREASLEEARRVLRPGGRFLMMEHCEPRRPFVRFLYRVRLATLGSARNRSFAQDEIPFLRSFFGEVERELSPTGRSKLLRAVKEAVR